MRSFIGMLTATALCLAMLFMVSGCATIQNLWDGDADPASTQAALCKDAQLGLAIWSAMQEGSTPEAVAYWAAYKKGVDIAVKAYCAGGLRL